MNILTPNFYAYRSPAFGTNSRIYENPIQDVQAGTTNIYTTTYLLRGDLDFKKVVDYAKEKNCKAMIMIGGAVITDDYREQIGAHGYAKDAAEAVKIVQNLLA